SLRARILARDGHRCRHCRATGDLQVHHRQYHIRPNGAWLPPWQYHPTLLVTLCTSCHKHGHTHYKVPVFTINLQPSQ
ncbi:MAG TPA: hypothetical protein VK907_11500, partial [Phnomibacter sp.]|nr:hypothetical protein [Phnomibacter sp.]